MKIVMTYDTGDYTFCCVDNVCIEYESVEGAYSDFVDSCRKAVKWFDEYKDKCAKINDFKERVEFNRNNYKDDSFIFCNREYIAGDFIKDGVETFPEFEELNEWFDITNKEHFMMPDMDLRDYFAAHAPDYIVKQNPTWGDIKKFKNISRGTPIDQWKEEYTLEYFASQRYEYADAMMKNKNEYYKNLPKPPATLLWEGIK